MPVGKVRWIRIDVDSSGHVQLDDYEFGSEGRTDYSKRVCGGA